MKRSASKPDAYRKWREHRVALAAGQQHHHEPTRVVGSVRTMPNSDSERQPLMPLSSRFGVLHRPRPNRSVVPFLNGAGPSTGWSERSSRMAGGFERRRAQGGVNTQRPEREARGRTVLRPSRGRRKTCWPASSVLWLWVVGFRLGDPRGAGGAASHSFAMVLHEAVREGPGWAGVVRPLSSSTAPVGGSWHYPACTKS